MESPLRKLLLVAVAALALLAAQAAPAIALSADIQLLSPANGSWTNKSYAELPFRFTFSDPANAGALCTLRFSGMTYGPAPAGNGTANEFFLDQEIPQGRHEWNVTCENGTVKTSALMELFYDNQAPSIGVTSPADGSAPGTLTMNATFYYNDLVSPDASCTLYANGSAAATGRNMPRAAMLSIAFGWAQDGTYAWNVSCADRAGNVGTSETRSISVARPRQLLLESPGNTIYDRDDIEIRFHEFFAGTPYWTGYRLDGGAPVTLSGNSTARFPAGTHILELIANETPAASQRSSVTFTVNPLNPISFSSLSDSFARNWFLVNVSLSRQALWCGVSADGEDNVTMQNPGPYSWDYTFYGLPEGEHTITVHCNYTGRVWSRSATVSIYLSPFTVDIISPQNTTYWKSTSAEVSAKTSMTASWCALRVGDAAEIRMENESEKSWNYSLGGLDPGAHTITVRCTGAGLSNASSVSFTVTTLECLDSTTGACTGAQECRGSMCVDIQCEGCAYAADHACVSHECCADTDCLKSSECFSNSCVPVECPCGAVREHECVTYECCSSAQCGQNEECDADAHKCVGKKLLLMAPDMTVGEQALIRVRNQNNESVPGVQIIIEYEDGSTETLTTREDGTVLFTPSRAGEAFMTASLEGYETDTSSPKVAQSYFLLVIIAVVVAVGAGGAGAFFFFSRMSGELSLSKSVSGQQVTIRVKNRGSEEVGGVIIMDSVPAGSFIGCSIEPSMEQIAGETHMTWSASLAPGEEIVITYQAAATSKGFSVSAGDRDYHGGGFLGL